MQWCQGQSPCRGFFRVNTHLFASTPERESDMFVATNAMLREDMNRRAQAVLTALGRQGVTNAALRERFLATFGDSALGEAAWERLSSMDSPTAAELRAYASVLGVSTTWLYSGDIRFADRELLAQTCLCAPVPEKYHFVYYGAVEPGSAMEHMPDCVVHARELTEQLLSNSAIGDLIALPAPSFDEVQA